MSEKVNHASHKNINAMLRFDNELDGNQFNFFSRERLILFCVAGKWKWMRCGVDECLSDCRMKWRIDEVLMTSLCLF
jgi:hypothetical protein